jgi:Glycosyl hydrolase family 1
MVTAAPTSKQLTHLFFFFHPSLHPGYKQRFGLTYVDYKTQTRYPKESFDYVSQLWGNPKTEWPLKKDGAGAAAPAASAAGK